MNKSLLPSVPDVIHVGQLEIRYLHEAGNGCHMGCFELTVPPDAKVPPPHSHATEEIVYVLEGTLRFTVDKQTRDLQPGQSMVTPRGVPHGFSNPYAVVARALVINSPDIGAEYFREMGAIINESSPPDQAKLLAAMLKFGLTPVNHPGAR